MADAYLTLQSISEFSFKEKGSKFIAVAQPVQSEEEVKLALAGIKKRFPDANHYCYAYILGENQQHYRANDDGEPAHTAGTPILGQLRSRNLSNALIVVVRYFGGTKLGVPGLIAAYKKAAHEVVTSAHIIERPVLIQYLIECSFAVLDRAIKAIAASEGKIISSDYQLNCQLHVQIPKKNAKKFLEMFDNNHNLDVQIKLA